MLCCEVLEKRGKVTEDALIGGGVLHSAGGFLVSNKQRFRRCCARTGIRTHSFIPLNVAARAGNGEDASQLLVKRVPIRIARPTNLDLHFTPHASRQLSPSFSQTQVS